MPTPRMRKAGQINFEYNYQRDDDFIRKMQYVSKDELMKEAKRLASLTCRRIKQLEKRDYSSVAMDLVKERTQKIRNREDITGTTTTVSKRMSEQDLRDLIRTYDKFLTSKTSTYKQVEKRAEEFKERLEKDYQRESKQLSTSDLSRIQKILVSSDFKRLVNNGVLSSDQVIDMAVNAKESSEDFIYKLNQIYENDVTVDLESKDALEKFFNVMR